jgi:hypothetical protein
MVFKGLSLEFARVAVMAVPSILAAAIVIEELQSSLCRLLRVQKQKALEFGVNEAHARQVHSFSP